MKRILKKACAYALSFILVFTLVIPFTSVAAATDPEVVYKGTWGDLENLFSVTLLNSMAYNANANQPISYSVYELPGYIQVSTGYPDRVTNWKGPTVRSIIVALGYDEADFTGNVVSVSDSHMALRFNDTWYTSVSGNITMPTNSDLLAAEIWFRQIPDGYVFEYPTISVGDVAAGILDINSWTMPGYSSLPGYREVMPVGIPLSSAVNLLSYDMLMSDLFGARFTNMTYTRFGVFRVVPDADISYFQANIGDLLDYAGIEIPVGVDPILSFSGFDTLQFRVLRDDGGFTSRMPLRDAFVFDSFDQMRGSTISFSWNSVVEYMEFPFLSFGYVWYENANGLPLTLNGDTWPVFSDYTDVPGYAGLSYVPVTDAVNLISYDFLEAGLGTYGELSMPTHGLFEFVVTDSSKWGKETTFQLGTFGELCRLAGVNVPSSEFKLSVTGFNGSNALGKYWFYLTDTDQNFPWAFTGAIRTQEPLLGSDSDLASWPLSWKLYVPSNGIISIEFPVISFGSLFFKDAAGAYVGLTTNTWPDFSDVNDVPTNPDYSQGYQDGYEAGFAAGSANGSYQDGYDAGLSVGHEQGYTEGYQAGDVAGYDRGYLAGFEAGAASVDPGDDDGSYNAGFLDGYASGREQGYSDGFSAGKKAGYDEGYGAGKADGYNEGYQDASGMLSGTTFNPMSLWDSIYVEVRYYVDTLEWGPRTFRLSWEVYNNPVDVPYYEVINNRGEIDTAGIVEWILNDVAPNYDGMDAAEPRFVEYMFTRINLKESISTNLYKYYYSFNINGDVRGIEDKQTKITFIDVAGNIVAYRSSPIVRGENLFSLGISEIGATKSISIVTYAEREDTGLNLGITFDISNGENSFIYNNGYTDGYGAGQQDSFDKGLAAGYQNGFTAGKIEGLDVAKVGDWKSLIYAVCEAPVNTFQSLFKFEILGLDMRVAFGSMLSLSVLVFIIKKVFL